jgi:hypothetical protein
MDALIHVGYDIIYYKELIPSGVDCLFMLKISFRLKEYIKTYLN